MNTKSFKWIGEGTPIKSRRNTDYKSFSSGGVIYNIDDFVLIRNDDSIDPEDNSNCYVAQITELYDTGNNAEPYQAKVKWFSRVSDLPQHCKKTLDILHKNEVVLDNRQSWSNIIDAETIFSKCQIVFTSVSEVPESLNRSKNSVYFCRYKLLSNKLRPLESDYLENKSYATPNQKVTKKGKEKYCAIDIGNSKFPKVLIKKVDQVLPKDNENIKVRVAKSNLKCVEDVARTLDDLTLLSPLRTPRRKRSYIHSLVSNNVNQNSEANSLHISNGVEFEFKNDKKTYSPKCLTPRRASNRQSCGTPKSVKNLNENLNTPSPKKFIKSSRRCLEFSVDSGSSLTRSGRKVNPVVYCERNSSEDESKKPVLASAKNKISNFLRITYSDDSGSESVYSSSDVSDSSSGDEEMASDSSVSNKKQKPRLSKLKKTPASKKKGRHCNKDLIIPNRKTPSKEPQNILEESRIRLHVSAVPKSLPCREEEFSDIYSFVKGCLCSHTGGCMYVSGVPGTGKTATVHEVIRRLEEEKEEGEIPIFNFVEVNGMWMTDPYQCYVHIFKSLTGKTIASQQAANLLEKRFTEPGPKKDAVILLVDELDRLWTRKQTVMYNIFDWPSKKHSKLIVIAIANTMDLPERLMMNRISSRLGLTRRTFQPYNFKQLQQIILSRIQELQVFDSDAVQFVARKVAAVSGDARRALDICRHATEIAELSMSSPKKKSKILVGMEHVDIAIQRMFSSPMIAAIRTSSKLEKLFFQCILADFNWTGSEESTLFKVTQHLSSTCRLEGIEIPSDITIKSMCARLSHAHLIIVDNFQSGLYMKIRLNASPDDVNFALTGKSV